MTADHKPDRDGKKNYIAAIQHQRRFMVPRKFINLKDHSDPSAKIAIACEGRRISGGRFSPPEK